MLYLLWKLLCIICRFVGVILVYGVAALLCVLWDFRALKNIQLNTKEDWLEMLEFCLTGR